MRPPTVTTSLGAVRGLATEHGATFLGIPYAAPPVGDLRHRPPRRAAPWDGTLDATHHGPPAPQAPRQLAGLETEGFMGPAWTGTDPALTVNVWTPDPGTSGLPVLVFIHGGAFVAGAPSAPAYDGARFGRDGIVCVSFVYRVGVEGFLALEGADTNVGMRDQLAALRWVADEIAAFGGDPGNVTVCGHSAGAMCLDSMLGGAPFAGLARRAISQSGGARAVLTPEQAAVAARAVADRLGIAPTAEAFRRTPIAEVVNAQAQLTPDDVPMADNPSGGLIWLMPVADGDVVPTDPLAAAASAPVDLLAGSTTEEGRFYLAGTPGFDDGGAALAEQITEQVFRGPTRDLLAAHARGEHTTYAYEFAWRSQAIGGRLGACHVVEVPFVFDTTDADDLRGEHRLLGPGVPPPELTRQMHGAWVAYATDGDPGWAPGVAPVRFA